MQWWKKQNIFEFRSFWNWSKIIIIEKPFMPIYSGKTSTTHSAKIRRRWSANWVMWSYWFCETIPRIQWYHCLLWNQGIVYCTCGQCFRCSEYWRKFNKRRLYAHYPELRDEERGLKYGVRLGKTKEQTEYQKIWTAWKRCCQKVDSQGEHFKCIHDRFLRDPVYCGSQVAIGWTD